MSSEPEQISECAVALDDLQNVIKHLDDSLRALANKIEPALMPDTADKAPPGAGEKIRPPSSELVDKLRSFAGALRDMDTETSRLISRTTL